MNKAFLLPNVFGACDRSGVDRRMERKFGLWHLVWILPLITGLVFGAWEFVETKYFSDMEHVLFLNILVWMAFTFIITFSVMWIVIKSKEKGEKELKKAYTDIAYLKKISDDIVKHSPVGIQMLDKEGRITLANPAMIEIMGIERNIIGENFIELPSIKEAGLYEYFKKAYETEEPFEIPNSRYVSYFSKKELYLTWDVVPIKGDSGKVESVLILVDDTTDKKKAEEERERLLQQIFHSEKLASIGILSAGVAHEINTPLTNISLLTENVLRKTKEENTRDKMENISQQVDAAAKIVKSLLEFSRKSEPRYSVVDLNDILRDTLDFLEEKMLSNIRIVTEFHPEPLIIKGDRNQLRQVFINIINNAYDAMPRGGILTVKTASSPTKGFHEVTISDTGTGIPKEDLGHIFDPFFTTKGGDKGTGLGLSIVHGIVEDHKGAIDVSSKVGEGTAFTIKFLKEGSSKTEGEDGKRERRNAGKRIMENKG